MNTIKDKKVLIVEDDKVNSAMISRFLLKKWIDSQNITIAPNWKDALTKTQEQLFDIIIMDIRMPVMDGREATKHIRSHYNGDCPKIIANSALPKIQGDDQLFDEYILKASSQGNIANMVIKILLAQKN
jgi:CheY-like chemotaxis protein